MEVLPSDPSEERVDLDIGCVVGVHVVARDVSVPLVHRVQHLC